MTMSFLQLGWRTLWRDARAGELRLLWVAVALAVAALTSVSFFANRLEAGLARDARQLLGGDVVIASNDGQLQSFVQQARQEGLRHATTLVFPTMGRASDERGGNARLVALKAVEAGYPLRGKLRVAQGSGQGDIATDEIPPAGQAWVDAGLLAALEINIGDTLLLGDASLRIGKLITAEPDRGAGFMSFAPRVMINTQDLGATGLVQPASRITWRLAVAGDDAAAVARYEAWAKAQVVAVESAASSVRDLRRNAELNDVAIEIRGGDAARELSQLGRLDALVVDPPRAGLAKGVVPDISAAGPCRVIYVSCDPATLARDLALFEREGYYTEWARPVDLFPQTFHVESVVLMSRA